MKIEIVGPGGRRVIAEKDLRRYIAKGYRPIHEVVKAEEVVSAVSEWVEMVNAAATFDGLDQCLDVIGLDVDFDDDEQLYKRKARVVEIIEGEE